MTALHPQTAIAAALAHLFPPDVAVAVLAIGSGPAAPLMPEEEPAIAGAVAARIAEFSAGREAARRAMAALDLPRTPIPAGTDRAPVWPVGLVGSIAHADGIAAAAVRLGSLPLGLDLEPDAALEPDLWPLICDVAELASLPAAERGRAVRRVFSAKEAVYKAQYPLTRQLIGFDAVAVTLRDDGFDACFRRDVGPLPAGHRMHGCMARAGGFILTGVTT